MYRITKNESGRRASLALAVALACVVGGTALAQTGTPPGSGNSGSDKAQSGAVDPKILKAQPIPGMPSGPFAAASTSGAVQLATTTLHTSAASDLSIHFTSECYVYTQDGNTSTQDTGETQATATVWIEVDGQPVPVTASTDASATPDDGKVGLCSRTQTLSSTLSDQDAISLAALSHAAHGFNWTAANLAAGDHTVNVMATLDASANGTGQGTAAAVIGKRTLQVSAQNTNNSDVNVPQNPPKKP